ncbi:hypothetical protein HID58_088505 [Brassica napus]|uniref:Photosystem I assembly protein Ycf4 n=1 Tax=Brassica napus TaxID=3708 RepID=A0ABQ7XWD4_BRANA|nr:hypothetical protein HID58_088505 [Brassica napus]
MKLHWDSYWLKLPLHLSKSYFPQGIVMSFYGIAGLFISFYLLCTILWNVGSGFRPKRRDRTYFR